MRGRILIVDAVETGRIAFGAMLAKAFYLPLLAADGSSGLIMARQQRPDVILISLALPGADAVDLILTLRREPLLRGIPLIALAAGPGPETRMAAYRAGADYVMSAPVCEMVLLAWIRSLMRRREEASLVSSAWGERAPELLAAVNGLAEDEAPFQPLPRLAAAGQAGTAGEAAAAQPSSNNRRRPLRVDESTLGLITADPAQPSGWHEALHQRLERPVLALSPAQALLLTESSACKVPDIFLIETDPCAGSDAALRLMSQLSDRPQSRHSAFCLVLTAGDPAGTALALELGAADVLPPDLPAEEVELRLRAVLRRKQQTDRLRLTVEDGLRLAMIDPLTGCYNRRYALPRLAGISAEAAGDGSDFAVLIIDLDRFKAVNDQFGHAAGDAVLVEVARRLNLSLREGDLLARIGGEEFLIALPRCPAGEAAILAEALRNVVGMAPVRLGQDTDIGITISIGVAIGPLREGSEVNVGNLVERADLALRNSKVGGRNLVTVSRSAA